MHVDAGPRSISYMTDRRSALGGWAEIIRASPEAFVLPLTTGQPDVFFGWLTAQLAQRFQPDLVLVGDSVGAEHDEVQVLSARGRTSEVPAFRYDLRGTPCAQLFHRDGCVFEAGVADRFPDDHFLRENGIEAYAGIPLVDDHRSLGLIALLFGRPLDAGEVEAVQTELEVWRERATAELVRRRADRDVRDLVEIAEQTGAETCWSISEAVARMLGLRGAFVARATPEGRLFAPALVVGGERRPDVALGDLELQAVDAFAPDRAAERLPQFEAIRELGARAFWIRTIRDAEGEVVGAAGLLHHRPIHVDPGGRPTVQAFLARARAELLRERAEEQRRATEIRLWATQRRESLGLMAGGMAHDFNNLLVGVLGNAELLWSDTRSECARDIVQAAERAAELCRQMLAYAGRSPGQKTVVDLGASVRESVAMLRSSNPPGCRVELDLPDAPVFVEAIPAQLGQIVLNLVTNAREALPPEGGRVAIDLSRRATEAGAVAALRVADDGRGMDEATRSRIFEPFFSTKETGHGLGLAAVDGIVRSFRGALRVTSEAGRGTTFEVELPLAATPEDSADDPWDEAPTPARDPACGRLLLVDDDALVRETLERILRREGFEVVVAESGADALRAAQAAGPAFDLLIVDLTMPDLDGPAALRGLRGLTDAPALVVSGFGEHQTLKRFDGLGVRGVLSKPFRAEVITAAIRTALSEHDRSRDSGPVMIP